MKTYIILSVAVSLFITPAVIFHTAYGKVKMSSVTIKQGSGSLSVRPTGVVIKP